MAKRFVDGTEESLALRRENKEVLFSSMVKDTMKRKKPTFNEEYHGYRTFSELLEDAAANGLIEIERHKGSGTYVVTRFGSEPKMTLPPVPVRPTRAPRPQPEARPVPLPARSPQRPAPAIRKPAPAPVPVAEPADDLLDLIEDRYGE